MNLCRRVRAGMVGVWVVLVLMAGCSSSHPSASHAGTASPRAAKAADVTLPATITSPPSQAFCRMMRAVVIRKADYPTPELALKAYESVMAVRDLSGHAYAPGGTEAYADSYSYDCNRAYLDEVMTGHISTFEPQDLDRLRDQLATEFAYIRQHRLAEKSGIHPRWRITWWKVRSNGQDVDAAGQAIYHLTFRQVIDSNLRSLDPEVRERVPVFDQIEQAGTADLSLTKGVWKLSSLTLQLLVTQCPPGVGGDDQSCG